MASFDFKGLDTLIQDLKDIAELPDEVADAMLNAEADVVLEAQRAEAQKLGMYSDNERHTSETNYLPGQTENYSTGELARSIKKAKAKADKNGQRSVKIYFSGSRKRGNTTTKNSEIAFLNEFGTRTINARNFIRTANEKSAADSERAAANEYDKYLKSKNL